MGFWDAIGVGAGMTTALASGVASTPQNDPNGLMAWQQREAAMNQNAPQIGKGPTNQPPMSLEEIQRIWTAKQNDPNLIREAGETGQATNYPSQGTQAPSEGQDFRATFMGIVGNGLATPDALLAKEKELAAAGIKVLRNAAGVAGKVQLPTGEIVDVIQSAGTGGGVSGFQWQQGPGGPTGEGGKPLPGNRYYGQPGGGATGGASLGGLGGGVDYTARMGALEQTPGYQFRLKEGMDAIQRSAAAKGTLLTGGALKELASFGQGLASTEFGNEWDRQMGLAGLGFNAAAAQGAYGSSFGNQLTDLTTGAGNAQAAGTAGAGNVWGNALGNLGNLGVQWGVYNATKPPTTPPTQQTNQWQYPSNPWE